MADMKGSSMTIHAGTKAKEIELFYGANKRVLCDKTPTTLKHDGDCQRER